MESFLSLYISIYKYSLVGLLLLLWVSLNNTKRDDVRNFTKKLSVSLTKKCGFMFSNEKFNSLAKKYVLVPFYSLLVGLTGFLEGIISNEIPSQDTLVTPNQDTLVAPTQVLPTQDTPVQNTLVQSPDITKNQETNPDVPKETKHKGTKHQETPKVTPQETHPEETPQEEILPEETPQETQPEETPQETNQEETHQDTQPEKHDNDEELINNLSKNEPQVEEEVQQKKSKKKKIKLARRSFDN